MLNNFWSAVKQWGAGFWHEYTDEILFIIIIAISFMLGGWIL